jgi:hypothetical protein
VRFFAPLGLLAALRRAGVELKGQPGGGGAELPVGLDLRGGGQHRVGFGGVGGGQDLGLLKDDLGVDREPV